MKGAKRFITVGLLVAVYCLAAGGPAVASLLCRCMAATGHVDRFCCCEVHHAAAAEQLAEGPCCSDRHSTEVELYTFAPESLEKSVKRIHVNDLPPSLAVEVPLAAVADATESGVRIHSFHVACRPAPEVAVAALRAPPAC